MRKLLSRPVYNNLANGVSILGVLPLCLLFLQDGYGYLIPLIVYNNIMDDLDGILAAKLDIKSEFGAILDNVCDAFSHSVFVMLVGMQFAGLQERVDFAAVAVVVASLVAATAVVLRVVFRLSLPSAMGTGSPTNELVRHLMFILLLTDNHEFNPGPVLILVFALHAVSMLAPFRMPFLIRSLTKSATAIGLVNIALVVAWLVPFATPVIAAGFICTYLYSFSSGTLEWLRKSEGQVSI